MKAGGSTSPTMASAALGSGTVFDNPVTVPAAATTTGDPLDFEVVGYGSGERVIVSVLYTGLLDTTDLLLDENLTSEDAFTTSELAAAENRIADLRALTHELSACSHIGSGWNPRMRDSGASWMRTSSHGAIGAARQSCEKRLPSRDGSQSSTGHLPGTRSYPRCHQRSEARMAICHVR